MDLYPDIGGHAEDPDIEALAGLRARIEPHHADDTWFGLRESPGWWPLLARLAEDLAVIAPDFTVTRIGRRWGMLDFRAQSNSDDAETDRAFRERIWEAGPASSLVCQRCSQEGALSHTGNDDVRTLCRDDRTRIAEETGIRYEPMVRDASGE